MNNEHFELVLNLPKQVSPTERQVRLDVNVCPAILGNVIHPNLIGCCVLVEDEDPIKEEIEQWYKFVYDPDRGSLGESRNFKAHAYMYKYNERCCLVGKWSFVGLFPHSIDKEIYVDKESFGRGIKSYIMHINLFFENFTEQEVSSVDTQPEKTTITRDDADHLTVRMMQANRLRFLADDLHTALLNYRTPALDEQTSRKFYNYIKYIEGMQKELKNEFLNLKSEVIKHMSE